MKNKDIVLRALKNAIKEIESMPDSVELLDVRSNSIKDIYFSDVEKVDNNYSVIMYLG